MEFLMLLLPVGQTALESPVKDIAWFTALKKGIKTGGIGVKDNALDSSVRRKIITEFKNKVKSDYLTLYWDGKLFKQISGQKFEYLTVLVSDFPNCVEGKILSMKPL